MAMGTMYPCTSQNQYIPDWKCILHCCEKCPGIIIPHHDTNTDAIKTCSTIHFNDDLNVSHYIFMLYAHTKHKQHVICVPMILFMQHLEKYTHKRSSCYLKL